MRAAAGFIRSSLSMLRTSRNDRRTIRATVSKRHGQKRKFQISPVRVREAAEAVVSRTNLNNHMRRQACRHGIFLA